MTKTDLGDWMDDSSENLENEDKTYPIDQIVAMWLNETISVEKVEK